MKRELVKLCTALETLALQAGALDTAAQATLVRVMAEALPDAGSPSLEIACEGEGVPTRALDDGDTAPSRGFTIGDAVEFRLRGVILRGSVHALDAIAVERNGVLYTCRPGDVRRVP